MIIDGVCVIENGDISAHMDEFVEYCVGVLKDNIVGGRVLFALFLLDYPGKGLAMELDSNIRGHADFGEAKSDFGFISASDLKSLSGLNVAGAIVSGYDDSVADEIRKRVRSRLGKQ